MWKIVLDNLIPIVFAIATPIVLVLANDLMAALAKKFNLESAMIYQSKVDDLITKGIAAAEKASANALKSTGQPTSGEQKLQMVIDFVNAQLAQHNLPQMAGDALAKLVDAQLAKSLGVPAATSKPLNG